MKEKSRELESMELENRETGSRKTELLGNAPVPKALLAMGLPTMIGMMINALYNLVGAFFVGGSGTSQMEAISAIFPLGQAMIGLGLLSRNRAASYISRLLGRGDKDMADQIASTALYSNILTGILMIPLTLIFLIPTLRLLDTTQGMLPYALTYRGIYVVSSILNMFDVTMNNIVASEGATRTTMCAPLLGAVLNMALNPVFTYGLDLGVAGAAIATALSQVISSLVYLAYALYKKNVLIFRPSQYRYSSQIMPEVLKISIPTLIFQLLTDLPTTLINVQAKGYGDSVIAGMGVITGIIPMGSLMVSGFLKGFQPIAGYNYRARRYDRLYQAIRTSILWSIILCTMYGLVMAVFPTTIISQFTEGDMEMIQARQEAPCANGLSFLLFGHCAVYFSLFLALGRVREDFILSAYRQGICFIPIVLAFPTLWGIDGILYAQPTADIVSAVVAMTISVRPHRKPLYTMPSNT